VKYLKEDSFKLSIRKSSFENQPHGDFNNSLLSDSQNFEWLQKRFEKINEENQSNDEKCISAISGRPFSKFGKSKLKMDPKNASFTQPTHSVRTHKMESGRVHCVQNDDSNEKISGMFNSIFLGFRC
jgi:3',5'-cyclic AMP phosphodiesterase CpdA